MDASVTLAWCFPDEQSEYADRIIELLRDQDALVPNLWGLEVANGLLVAERRGRVTQADLVEIHKNLSTLPIGTRELRVEEALGSLLNLARAQSLTAYDAAYLDLAMREGLPLATQDEELIAAAKRVGVQVIV